MVASPTDFPNGITGDISLGEVIESPGAVTKVNIGTLRKGVLDLRQFQPSNVNQDDWSYGLAGAFNEMTSDIAGGLMSYVDVPIGEYNIRGGYGSGAPLPTIVGPAKILGHGPNRTVFKLIAGVATGDALFHILSSGGQSDYLASGILTPRHDGVHLEGFDIWGVSSTDGPAINSSGYISSVQQEGIKLDGYHRFKYIRRVRVGYLNGCAYSEGEVPSDDASADYTTGPSYSGEASDDHEDNIQMKIRYCGNATRPAVMLASTGGGGDSDEHDINFDIFSPLGIGLWMKPFGNSFMSTFHCSHLRIEGVTSSSSLAAPTGFDLFKIGNDNAQGDAGSGNVRSSIFNNVWLLSGYAGGSHVNFCGYTSFPTDVRMQINVGGAGRGTGITLNGTSNFLDVPNDTSAPIDLLLGPNLGLYNSIKTNSRAATAWNITNNAPTGHEVEWIRGRAAALPSALTTETDGVIGNTIELDFVQASGGNSVSGLAIDATAPASTIPLTSSGVSTLVGGQSVVPFSSIGTVTAGMSASTVTPPRDYLIVAANPVNNTLTLKTNTSIPSGTAITVYPNSGANLRIKSFDDAGNALPDYVVGYRGDGHMDFLQTPTTDVIPAQTDTNLNKLTPIGFVQTAISAALGGGSTAINLVQTAGGQTEASIGITSDATAASFTLTTSATATIVAGKQMLPFTSLTSGGNTVSIGMTAESGIYKIGIYAIDPVGMTVTVKSNLGGTAAPSGAVITFLPNTGANLAITGEDDSGTIQIPYGTFARGTGVFGLAQIPTHPTPPLTDNSTNSATTGYVQAKLAGLGGGSLQSIASGTTATILAASTFIEVTGSLTGTVINLPTRASVVAANRIGLPFAIADIGGAGASGITFQTTDSTTISGAATASILTAEGALTVYMGASNWSAAA